MQLSKKNKKKERIKQKMLGKMKCSRISTTRQFQCTRNNFKWLAETEIEPLKKSAVSVKISKVNNSNLQIMSSQWNTNEKQAKNIEEKNQTNICLIQ